MPWEDITGIADDQGDQAVDTLLESVAEMHPADVAALLSDLPAKRRIEVARGLTDDRLADVLEEMGDNRRIEVLNRLDSETRRRHPRADGSGRRGRPARRPQSGAGGGLLELVEPDEAEDLRRLLVYEDASAGGMMTTEPIVLPPDATVAQALAAVRNLT